MAKAAKEKEKNYADCLDDVNSTQKSRLSAQAKTHASLLLVKEKAKNARRVPRTGVICTRNLRARQAMHDDDFVVVVAVVAAAAENISSCNEALHARRPAAPLPIRRAVIREHINEHSLSSRSNFFIITDIYV